MLDTYIKDQLKTSTLLTAQEETILLQQYSNTHAESVRSQLIMSNIKLVAAVAGNYKSSNLDQNDLFMYGIIGLCEGLDKFDADKIGIVRFSSFAKWHIKNQINIAMRDLSSTIRVPVNIQTDIKKALKEVKGDASLLNHKLAVLMNIGSHCTSMDAPAKEHDTATLHDILKDDEYIENDTIKSQLSDIIHSHLENTLNSREKNIIIKSFGLDGAPGRTLNEISDDLDITRERVRQIKEKAIKQIQKTIIGLDLTQTEFLETY
jgi:RNA polymerase sigma factor (sigma-70 family)